MHFNVVQSSAMTVLSFPISGFFNDGAYGRPAVRGLSLSLLSRGLEEKLCSPRDSPSSPAFN